MPVTVRSATMGTAMLIRHWCSSPPSLRTPTSCRRFSAPNAAPTSRFVSRAVVTKRLSWTPSLAMPRKLLPSTSSSGPLTLLPVLALWKKFRSHSAWTAPRYGWSPTTFPISRAPMSLGRWWSSKTVCPASLSTVVSASRDLRGPTTSPLCTRCFLVDCVASSRTVMPWPLLKLLTATLAPLSIRLPDPLGNSPTPRTSSSSMVVRLRCMPPSRCLKSSAWRTKSRCVAWPSAWRRCGFLTRNGRSFCRELPKDSTCFSVCVMRLTVSLLPFTGLSVPRPWWSPFSTVCRGWERPGAKRSSPTLDRYGRYARPPLTTLSRCQALARNSLAKLSQLCPRTNQPRPSTPLLARLLTPTAQTQGDNGTTLEL